MKKLHISLLLVTFISNLTSMQIQDEKILNLPNEILDNIVKQLMEEDFLKALNNWNDIFEEAPKPTLILIKNLGQSCKIFHDLCKDNLILKESLRLFNNLKERRFNQLLNSLKNNALKEYKGFSTEKLNNELAKALKDDSIYSNSKVELKKIAELILAGANVNTRNNYGNTALTWAVKNNHKEIIPILIKAGADVNIKDSIGDTTLMWAAENGLEDILERLIKAGADVNIKDNNGNTALMYAARFGYKDIAEILIKASAEVNAKDNDENTALMLAAENGREGIIEKLLNEKKININAQNKFGRTALIRAAYYGRKKIVEMLLNKGANVNIKDDDGRTALDYAIIKGHEEIAAILKNTN